MCQPASGKNPNHFKKIAKWTRAGVKKIPIFSCKARKFSHKTLLYPVQDSFEKASGEFSMALKNRIFFTFELPYAMQKL